MGAERREVPETIRVGFLEEMTCQLTIDQGIFQGPKEVLFPLAKTNGARKWAGPEDGPCRDGLSSFGIKDGVLRPGLQRGT